MWKELKGFRYPYRISEEGEIECKRTGEWKPVHVIPKKTNGNWYKPVVQMAVYPKGYKLISITKLMEGVWLPKREKGQLYIRKNSSSLDCSVYNIHIGDKSDAGKKGGGSNRKAVFKVDKYGNVLEVYRSCTEAAKKNHLDKKSISDRCRGKIKKAMEMDGFSFRYERG